MGGSKGKSPTITADNLYSQDILELGAAIGNGTIYGLEKGLESFYIGNIPFQSETGTYNFQDVCVSFRQGYYDDLPLKYIMGGEGSIIQETVGMTLPAEVTRTIITPPTHRGRIKQIDVRLLVSMLYAGDSKGNTKTSSLLLSIKYRKVGDTNWSTVTETTASLYSSKAQTDTLRQEASRRGLDYDAMSEADKVTFANEVLTDNQIITSANDLKQTYIPSGYVGGFGLSGLQGMSVQAVQAQKRAEAIRQQMSDNQAIRDAYNAGALTIEGKTTGGYVYELSIPIFDNEGDTHDWEIQITRLSKELTSKEKKFSNKVISLESMALITDQEKLYRKTAICHIVAQHTDRFDTIPDFSGDFYGLICDVPSNYNPFEHTYDEVTPWDGTYKKGWTNNPFWILRELIMNQDWGLRSIERKMQVDNANFYTLAKYCDFKVPTFDGKFAPRYTFNEVVQQKTKIKEYINYVAGAVHTTLREINGVYYAFMDKPNTPKFFVTPEMILQTNFQYSSSDLESKYNSVKVTFLNAENDYQQDRRTVIDNPSIEKYGLIPYEFQAVGCTNITEAIRQAVYALLTNRDEDIFTTFNLPRLGHLVNVYDHFYIAHKENGWGNHARILQYDTVARTIHLRDPIFEGTYTLYYHTPFGIGTVPVQSQDPYSLRILGDLSDSEYLQEETPIAIGGGVYGQPRVFRVLGVMQDDTTGASGGEVFEFKAATVSENKFVAVDNVNNPALVNLTFDVTETIYKREPTPTEPENVRLRYKDWSSYNGQLVYQVSFNTEVKAYYYDVVWVDETTGERRNKRIFGQGGELFPAFDRETSKVSLFITPFNSKGEAGYTKYIRDIVPYVDAETKLPILQGVESVGSIIKVKWSAETSDMFPYTFKYFSYMTPKETVTNIPLNPTDTEYSVPNQGEGKYSFQLVYDQDGSGSKMSSEVWHYNSTTNGFYIKPQINSITSSKKNEAGSSASGTKVFPQLTVTVAEWMTNKDLNQLTNPFAIRHEVTVGGDDYVFLSGDFYIIKTGDTTARIVISKEIEVGANLQIRVQNQWGTTTSPWSEALVPAAPTT